MTAGIGNEKRRVYAHQMICFAALVMLTGICGKRTNSLGQIQTISRLVAARASCGRPMPVAYAPLT